MIRLFTWPTPNGQKVQIMLEETELSYEAIPVNILRNEQFEADYLRLNPNGKVPTILDTDAGEAEPVSVFESGAILVYLAEKSGRFLPAGRPGRTAALEWTFFQCASLGPMLGQATHFRRYADETVAYAVDRYGREATRLYAVLERRLSEQEWLAGPDYTIADMATFPWICRHRRQGQSLDERPAIRRWLEAMSARPGVTRGMDLLKDVARETPLDGEAKRVLFGQEARA
jgi:GST-like protein